MKRNTAINSRAKDRLKDHLDLAAPASTEWRSTALDERPQPTDKKFASNQRRDKPGTDQIWRQMNQVDKGSTDHHLVDERIGDPSECRDQSVFSRQVTIEPVGGHAEDENHRSQVQYQGPIPCTPRDLDGEQDEEEHRDQQSGEGDLVGKIEPVLFRGHPIPPMIRLRGCRFSCRSQASSATRSYSSRATIFAMIRSPGDPASSGRKMRLSISGASA